MILKNKEKYEGIFEDDYLKNGNIKFQNGDEYNGFCNKGKKEGKGILKYNNGDEYNGD